MRRAVFCDCAVSALCLPQRQGRFQPQLFLGGEQPFAQCLHLAAALPSFHYPVEFAEFDHLLDDPFTGLEAVEGRLSLPQGVGSGLSQLSENA